MKGNVFISCGISDVKAMARASSGQYGIEDAEAYARAFLNQSKKWSKESRKERLHAEAKILMGPVEKLRAEAKILMGPEKKPLKRR
jgi:hypothetical protein